MGVAGLPLSEEQIAELRQYDGNGAGKTVQSRTQTPNDPKKKPLFEVMSTIEEEEIDCFWAGRVPRGKVTLFAGESEVGKSTVTSKIAATVSCGNALPFDKEPEAPLGCLLLSAEEGVADVVKKRLRTFGADQDMIFVPHRDIPLSRIDANFLDQILTQCPSALTIIDPITSYVHGQNITRPEIRNVIMSYVPVAEKHKTAIVMTAHLNRGTGVEKALDRILGSSEFRNIPRSIFLFALDSQNRERRLMTHCKCSFGPKQPTLEFFIEKDGNFRWGNQTMETADELLGPEQSRQREHVQMDRAKEFLEKMLSNGAVSSVVLEQEADKLGLKRAIWRAKPEMGIRARKAAGGRFFWSLPTE